jgi:hypothetical protein
MSMIILVGLSGTICLGAVAYFGWIGFIGVILLFVGPGAIVLYRRERSRAPNSEFDDKLGSARMNKALGELVEDMKKRKEDES